MHQDDQHDITCWIDICDETSPSHAMEGKDTEIKCYSTNTSEPEDDFPCLGHVRGNITDKQPKFSPGTKSDPYCVYRISKHAVLFLAMIAFVSCAFLYYK
jgi:hypothetical protein